MVMGPTSVAYVTVTQVALAHAVSAQWRTTVPLMIPTALKRQGALSAMGEETVCADSALVIQMSLVRCGANTASVMISTACASKGHCALVSRYIYYCHNQCFFAVSLTEFHQNLEQKHLLLRVSSPKVPKNPTIFTLTYVTKV